MRMALDVAQLQVSPDRGAGKVRRFTVNFGLSWRILPESPLTTLIREAVVRPLIRGFLTPENWALGEALLAYSEYGDVRPMWALVEERTGYPPDSLLRNRLRGNELKRPQEWEISEFWRMLNAYAPRLAQKADDRRPEGKRTRDIAEKFLRDSKSYGKLERSLSEYKTPKERREEVLKAVFLAEKGLQPGAPLESLTLSKIEWPIERDNRPLNLNKKSNKKDPNLDEARIVFSNDLLSTLKDPSTLAEFAAKHDKLTLDNLLRQAPSLLSPQQLEVFRLAASGLRNKEIAERANLSANQVGQVLFCAIKTLRRAVGY